MVGQPGQAAPEYPRSPHQRELPPTREPGLWAGDVPKASRPSVSPPPEILGVTLPFVNGDTTSPEDEYPTRACAAMMTTILPKVAERNRVESLTPEQRRCLAARLYEECASNLLTLVDGAQTESWWHGPGAQRLHAAVLEAAKRFEREACEGVVPSIAAKSLRDAVRKQWNREPWSKP